MTAGLSQPRFISLRWRLVLPVLGALMIAVMVGAFVLGQNLTAAANTPQTNFLIQVGDAVRKRANDLYEQTLLEAQRVAFTRGVPQLTLAQSAVELQPILESSARLAKLDSIIVTDAQGIEVAGVLRVEQDSQVAYAVSTGTDLHVQSVIRYILDEGATGAAGLLRTPQGLMLYTAIPMTDNNQRIGLVLVGRALDNLLAELKADGIADLALYDAQGELLQSTLPSSDFIATDLALALDVFQQSLSTSDQLVIRPLTHDEQGYQVGYTPFRFGADVVGLTAVLLPDSVPAISQTAQQLGGLTFAAVAGAGVLALSGVLYMLVIRPAAQVTAAASALTAGNPLVRTGMQPVNEVAAAGHALDQFADYVQERQDALRASLRRQRREFEFLQSVLESMPDGVLVHDQNGQVVVMNEQARGLLGTQPNDRLNLRDLTPAGSATYKPLAPGLYTLGEPHRLEWDGHMVSAQATAIMNLVDQRVGTLVVLRDITKEVRREQVEEQMLKRLADEAHVPLTAAARAELSSLPMKEVALGLSRHAGALQKLIFAMREMTMPDAPAARESQSPLYLDTLIWVIANEWRQIATAANLSLEVLIEKRGLFVLGDERRLRWAVGNLVDNAIKYTPAGGKLTLEINGETDGRALMRVRDNGVGISREDAAYLATRFFRGTPRLPDGEVMRVPGTGQGLYVAKQIIEAHGGMLQIKSKPGVGTAAYFTLPITSAVGYQLPLLQNLDHEGETIRVKHTK
ncbi:MAG: PAS domain-containing protein [Chloroflexi bacterium]|nr:PAS domain-containing protein [Chloroflexota bacterium]MCC6897101.1 PAS domain-containing protein [Anaerolineae bacterium]